MDVRVIYRTCPTCGHRFGQPDDPGRKRRFCSDACKQAAYRARKRAGSRPASEPRTTPAASGRSRPAGSATALGLIGRRPTPAAAAQAHSAARAAATAVPTPSTTIRPPTSVPGAATTASTPRPTAPGFPRGQRLPGQGRAAPGQVRPLMTDVVLASPRPD
jgi:hypothetical protein